MTQRLLRRGSVGATSEAYRRLFSDKCLGRRWLRGATMVSAKESLFNLYRDLIQPSLSPVCPVLVMPGRCLRVSYPVFSGAKLSRQLVSHFHGLLIVCLGSIGRLVKQAQNRLACCVKRVASFQLRTLRSL
jgi:hypothetical protein